MSEKNQVMIKHEWVLSPAYPDICQWCRTIRGPNSDKEECPGYLEATYPEEPKQ